MVEQTGTTPTRPTDHASMILMMDKYQGRPDALACPQDPKHGRLTVHGSGSALICGACRGDLRNGADYFAMPITNEMLTDAAKYVEDMERGRPRFGALLSADLPDEPDEVERVEEGDADPEDDIAF